MLQEKDITGKVLSCLLSKDGQTGRWLAHCLDFDLLTSAKTEEIAWENLRKVVRAHIEHCFAFHREGLELQAESSEWSEFRRVEKRLMDDGLPIRTEKITLKLATPTKPWGDDLWIKGVETFGQRTATASLQ